jgi:hypothetical protein
MGVNMLGGKKLWALVLCFCFLIAAAMPALAADPEVTKKDLKGINPRKYRYFLTTAGGAVIGMGVGVLVGGGNDVTKGLMVGGGAASAFYLHSHPRDPIYGWRNFAYVASYSSLGGGLGWTICACNDGLVSGLLIGGGGSAIFVAEHPQRTSRTAGTTNTP